MGLNYLMTYIFQLIAYVCYFHEHSTSYLLIVGLQNSHLAFHILGEEYVCVFYLIVWSFITEHPDQRAVFKSWHNISFRQILFVPSIGISLFLIKKVHVVCKYVVLIKKICFARKILWCRTKIKVGVEMLSMFSQMAPHNFPVNLAQFYRTPVCRLFAKGCSCCFLSSFTFS